MLDPHQPLNPNPKPLMGWGRETAPQRVAAANVQAAQMSPVDAPQHPKPTGPIPAFGPAPLPDPSGKQADAHAVRRALHTFDATSDDDASVYVAYAIMERVSRLSQETQTKLLRHAQDTVNQSKRHEAGHTLDQVRGQNKSAVVNAIGLGSTTLLTIAGAMVGVGFNLPSLGQFATQFTQIVQPMINVVDRESARVGGTYHSNLATLALKDDAIDTQGGTRAEEAARGAKEALQERLRSAAELLSGHLQRKFDTLDRMAH